MAEKRITKKDRFEDIKAMLSGEVAPNGTTIDEAKAFLDHEVELLAKKNDSSKKKAKAAEENEQYYLAIVDYLSRVPDDCAGKTCSEIWRGVPELNPFNTSKVTSLLQDLKSSSRVVNQIVKGKSLYKLA